MGVPTLFNSFAGGIRPVQVCAVAVKPSHFSTWTAPKGPLFSAWPLQKTLLSVKAMFPCMFRSKIPFFFQRVAALQASRFRYRPLPKPPIFKPSTAQIYNFPPPPPTPSPPLPGSFAKPCKPVAIKIKVSWWLWPISFIGNLLQDSHQTFVLHRH